MRQTQRSPEGLRHLHRVPRLSATLCDPIDGSPPGSPVPGILQARIPAWLAISFSRESSQPRDRTQAGGPVFSSWLGFGAVPGRLSRGKQVVRTWGSQEGLEPPRKPARLGEGGDLGGPAGPRGAYAVGRWGSCWLGSAGCRRTCYTGRGGDRAGSASRWPCFGISPQPDGTPEPLLSLMPGSRISP